MRSEFDGGNPPDNLLDLAFPSKAAIDEIQRLTAPHREAIDLILDAMSTGVGRYHDLTSRLTENLLGPASPITRIVEAAQPHRDRLEQIVLHSQSAIELLTMPPPESEVFQILSRAINGYDLAVSTAGSVVSEIAAQLAANPQMESFNELLRRTAIVSEELSRLASAASANVLPLLESDAVSKLFKAIQSVEVPEDDFASLLRNASLSDTELRDIDDASRLVEEAISSLDASWSRWERINAALIALAALIDKYRTRAVVFFFLIKTFYALQGAAWTAASDIIHGTDIAVQAIVHVDNRPADIVRLARDRVSDLKIPPDILRVLRVVKKRRIAVFDQDHSTVEPIEFLTAGTIVQLETRARKWRAITWIDPESGYRRAGWVRAKGLAKLVRHHSR